MLRIDLFTLFPAICHAYLRESILKRAQAAGLLDVQVHNIRDYAPGKHAVTDEYSVTDKHPVRKERTVANENAVTDKHTVAYKDTVRKKV